MEILFDFLKIVDGVVLGPWWLSGKYLGWFCTDLHQKNMMFRHSFTFAATTVHVTETFGRYIIWSGVDFAIS